MSSYYPELIAQLIEAEEGHLLRKDLILTCSSARTAIEKLSVRLNNAEKLNEMYANLNMQGVCR